MLIFWRQKKLCCLSLRVFHVNVGISSPVSGFLHFLLSAFLYELAKKKSCTKPLRKEKRTLYSFSTQQDGLDLLNLSFEVSLKSGQKVLHEKSTLYKSNCRIAELLDFHWKNGTWFLFICLPSVPCRFIPWFEILGQILMR